MLLRYSIVISTYCHSLVHCSFIPGQAKKYEIVRSLTPHYDNIKFAPSPLDQSPHIVESDLTHFAPTKPSSQPLQSFRVVVKDLIKDLDNHREELDSIKKESDNLDGLFINIGSTELFLKAHDSIFPQETCDYFERSTKMLIMAYQRITTLKELRIAELEVFEIPQLKAQIFTLLASKKVEEADSRSCGILSLLAFMKPKKAETISYGFPTESFNHEIKEVVFKRPLWEFHGDSIVQDLKQVFNEPIPDLNRVWKKSFFSLHETVFKIFDIMVLLDCVEPESIRRIFREPQFLESFLNFIVHRFDFEIHENVIYSSNYITEHWFWLQLCDSSKALQLLGKDEEKFINTYHFKAQLRNFCENMKPKLQADEELSILVISVESVVHVQEIDQATIYNLVIQIVDFVMKDGTPHFLPYASRGLYFELDDTEFFLYKTLEFIERYISPGIFNLIEEPMRQDFEDRYNVIRLTFKTNFVHQQTIRFLQFSPPGKEKEVMRQVYFHQIEQVTSELKESINAVRQKNKYAQTTWLNSAITILQLERKSLISLNKYKSSP